MRALDLQGRTAVITGASRGLGAGLAERFLAAGLQLGLCARGPSPAATESARVLERRLDVRDTAAVDAFAADVAGRFGAIDLWVNNAGVLDPIGPVRDLDPAQVREHLDINVMGVVNGSRAFVRHLRQRGGSGVLLNISSGAARRPYAGWSAYCASKAAVDRFTECLHEEEAQAGLRVHAVAPGVIDTAMQERIRACSPEVFPEVDRFLELKRTDAFSRPAFVAEQLLRLAFDPAPGPLDVLLRLPAEHESPTGR